jgi:hypothetical protein
MHPVQRDVKALGQPSFHLDAAHHGPRPSHNNDVDWHAFNLLPKEQTADGNSGARLDAIAGEKN